MGRAMSAHERWRSLVRFGLRKGVGDFLQSLPLSLTPLILPFNQHAWFSFHRYKDTSLPALHQHVVFSLSTATLRVLSLSRTPP